MGPLRIIMVIHSNIFGGAERHAVLLASGLQERGHEVVFVCPRRSWTWTALEGIPVKRVNLPLNGTYDMYSLLRLAFIAKTNRADILHGHLTRSAFYVNLASRLSGVPSVVTAHATNTYKHFQGAKKIIAVSRAVQNSLIARGYTKDQIEVVYSGVEDVSRSAGPADRTLIRNSIGLNQHEFGIALIGRFIPDKGHDIALRALKLIEDLPVRLFFIGDHNTEWGKEIKGLIDSLSLKDRVVIMGHREDVRRLLPGLDFLVQPSRREALGLSVLEALSAGLPVLASRVGGLPEAVKDGDNGFLFEVGDHETLASLIRALVVDNKLYRRLSDGARKVYLNRFTVDRMVTDTIKIYNSVCKEVNR